MQTVPGNQYSRYMFCSIPDDRKENDAHELFTDSSLVGHTINGVYKPLSSDSNQLQRLDQWEAYTRARETGHTTVTTTSKPIVIPTLS